MNKRVAAFSNFFFNSTTVILNVITGLLMVPLYLRHFDVATYGAWLASGNLISMITVFESGLSSVVTQKLAAAYGNKDYATFARITGAGIVVASVMGAFVAIVGVALAPFIAGWVHVPAASKAGVIVAVMLASVAAGLSILFLTLGAVPQAWQRTIVPGFVVIAALLANIAATLTGLFLNLKVIALGMGPLASALMFIAGYTIYLLKMWRKMGIPAISFDLGLARDVWKESRMLLVARIASVLGGNVEAAVAAIFISPQASAVLVLTGRVVTLAQLFLDRIGSAVFAGVAHIAREPNGPNSRRALNEIILSSTCICGLGIGFAIAISQSIISLWVGPQLFGGRPLLLMISISAAFAFRKNLFSNLTVASGEINKTATSLAIEAVARIALLAGLAYSLKLIGIPTASAIASLAIMLVLAKVLARRFGQATWNMHSPGLLGFAVSIAIGLAWMWLVPSARTWLGAGLQVGAVGLLMVGVLLTVEREMLAVIHRGARSIKSAARAAGQPA